MFEFLLITLLLTTLSFSIQGTNSSHSPTTREEPWRLFVPYQSVVTSSRDFVQWDIEMIEFYTDPKCNTPFPFSESIVAEITGVYEPEETTNGDSLGVMNIKNHEHSLRFRSNKESSNVFWIEFRYPKESGVRYEQNQIRCVKILQRDENFAKEAFVQYESGNSIWNALKPGCWSDIQIPAYLKDSKSLDGQKEYSRSKIELQQMIQTEEDTTIVKKVKQSFEHRLSDQRGRKLQTSATNVALLGTATQSSRDFGGVPERAIDGDTNGDLSNVTHTQSETDPWWIVELDGTYAIETIIVYNRIDFSERILNFSLLIYFEGSKVYDSSDIVNDLTAADTGIIAKRYLFDISPIIIGDEVRVELYGDNSILSLAEVEVMAYSLPSSEPSTSSVPSALPSNEPSLFQSDKPSNLVSFQAGQFYRN